MIPTGLKITMMEVYGTRQGQYEKDVVEMCHCQEEYDEEFGHVIKDEQAKDKWKR